MKTRVGFLLNVILIISMLMVAFPMAAQAKAPVTDVTAPLADGPEPQVSTANEEAIKKIEPEIRPLAIIGVKSAIKVAVLVKPGTDIRSAFEVSKTLPGPEFDRVIGMLPANRLIKVASGTDVYAILNMGVRPAPDPIRLTDEDGNPVQKITRSLADAKPAPASWDFKQFIKEPKTFVDSFFTEDTNGVRLTWLTYGITGVGEGWGIGDDTLKMAIIDTGVDFANPDLVNTTARITSPASPYFNAAAGYGWPIAFDDRSMSDFALGLRDARHNFGWYMTTDMTTGVILDDTMAVVGPIPPGGLIVDPKPADVTVPFYIQVTDVNGLVRTFTISPDLQGLPGNPGIYKFGWHPDDSLVDGYGFEIGVLVMGSSIAPPTGPFNIVAVDMNGDNIFSFLDPPAFLGNEVVGLNLGWSSPGVYDISGGMIYYISDGVNPVPASNWMYGMPPVAPGDIVAFMLNDVTEAGGDHGTLCGGTAIGQGNIVMMPYAGSYGSTYWPPTWYNPALEGGISQGPAPDAGLVAMGNYYQGGSSLNFYDFAALGYDGIPAGAPGDNYDQPHMASNSYGSGAVNNDGWDVSSRYMALINHGYIAQYGIITPDDGAWTPAFIKSAGNSGFGYGTVNVPMPETGIVAGASAVFGQFNLGDTAINRNRVQWGDLTGMSDRGPTSMSTLGMHVLTNGFFGSGNLALNEFTGGDWAVDYWAGTSRSSPEAMGILALIYDAYLNQNGSYPSWREARALLMNGARTAWNDPFAQGAGLANAFNSVEIIFGARGVEVLSSEGDGFWTPGNWRGNEIPGFGRGLFSGQTDTETFTVNNFAPNPLAVNLTPVTLNLIDSRNWNFTSLGYTPEGPGTRYYDRLLYGPAGSNPTYGATDPVYVSGVDDALIQNADLLVVRLSWPFSQFQNNVNNNWWFVYAWGWWDNDASGTWFNDVNGNGVRNSGEFPAVSETVRMNYDYHGNTAEIRIQQPWARMNGIGAPNDPPMAAMTNLLISLRHVYATASVNTTDLKVTFELYEEQPWDEIELSAPTLVVPAEGTATFNATARTIIEGAILLTENFDAVTAPALPAGWAQVDTSGTAGEWTTVTTGTYPTASPHSAPNMAKFNSYSVSSGSTRLYQTGGMNWSAVPGAVVNFWMYHDTGYSSNNDRIQVQVSTDGGTNWTNEGTAVSRYDGSTGWKQHQVDLSAYAGYPDVRLGFNAISAYGNNMYIDDLEVKEMVIEPPGEYTGYIKVTYTLPYPYAQYIPINKQIWFPADIDPLLGGVNQPTLYDNGVMFGATGTSSSQRAESGDWRFFYTDVLTPPAPGTFLLAHTTWAEDPAVVVPPFATDIDTLIMGPMPNDPLFLGQEAIIGPHGMDIIGGSLRSGSGPAWNYYTTSGGPSDWSSAMLKDPGLYAIAAQVVRWGGHATTMPYAINVGTAEVTPVIEFAGLNCVGCPQPFTFKTNHTDLAGQTLEAVAYGWTQPVNATYPITFDEYVDVPYVITATDAYSLEVRTSLPIPGEDIDLEVWRDNNSNGIVDAGDVRVGSSGRSDSEERVFILNPGAGAYIASVYGYKVTGTQNFQLTIEEVSGMGAMHVTNIPASINLGQSYTMNLVIDTPPATAGRWMGMVFLGPVGSPYAIQIPVIARQGDALKTIDKPVVKPGETATYTITLTEQPGTPVVWNLTDVIPAGWDILSVTGADYDPATRTLSWSNQVCVVDWIDATGGTLLTQEDDGEGNVTMPFSFNYYGATPSANLRVGNNGAILFGVTTGDVSFSNVDLTGSAPNNFIAPFWDDMDDSTSPAGVYALATGSTPNQQQVVEWHNVPHWSSGGGFGAVTFETIFNETTNDIWFLYHDVIFGNPSIDRGASATVGLRGASASEVTQFSYNSPALQNGWALHYVRVSDTEYSLDYSGPRCDPPTAFGTHTITIQVQANGSVLGDVVNTAHVYTGPNDCTVSAATLIAAAIPTWTKEVKINDGPWMPWDAMLPFLVADGDTILIRDRVSVESDDPVEFSLLSDYDSFLTLVSAVTDFGTVDTSTPGSIVWDVTGGVSLTEYTLTKTFTADVSLGWVAGSLEQLDTTGFMLLNRGVGFQIPATVVKSAPAEVNQGDTFTYSITVESGEYLLGPITLTDVLPAGVTYAGNLTVTPDYGTASYNPATNTVTWIVAAGKGSPRVISEVTEPLVYNKEKLGDQKPTSKSPAGQAGADDSSHIQGLVTLLTEGFEGGTMPPAGGWTTQHLGATTRQWTLVDAVTYPTFVRTGNYAAWVNYDSAAASNEWLFTPAIDLTGATDATLSFFAVSDTLYPTATMKVWATDVAGNPLTAQPLWDMVRDETWSTFEYREVVVDLSAYAGQTIKLAWQYVGLDGESFGLDDITLFYNEPDITSVTITFDVTATGERGTWIENLANLNVQGFGLQAMADTYIKLVKIFFPLISKP